MSGVNYLYTFHGGDDFNETIRRHVIAKTTDKQVVLCGEDWGWLFDEYNFHGKFIRPATFDDIQWNAAGRYTTGHTHSGGLIFSTRRIAVASFNKFSDGSAYHHPSREVYFTEARAREIFDRDWAPRAARVQ